MLSNATAITNTIANNDTTRIYNIETYITNNIITIPYPTPSIAT